LSDRKTIAVCKVNTWMKKIKTLYNNAYSLWRVNIYKQGFRSVASFGFSGQESALKPPQAICKPLVINYKL
jgi:hypothetical protein